MKTFKILCFFFFVCFTAHAQTEKGRFLIGAGTNVGLSESSGIMNLSFSRQKTFIDDGLSSQSNTNNILIAPKGGYFIVDNLVTGLDMALGWGSGTLSSDGASHFSNQKLRFSVGPFVRYYLL
jgi:hypothetical protein